MPANPTSVQEAREALRDLLTEHPCSLADVYVDGLLDDFAAAVRSERDAEIRGRVERLAEVLVWGVEAEVVYRADLLAALTDREAT